MTDAPFDDALASRLAAIAERCRLVLPEYVPTLSPPSRWQGSPRRWMYCALLRVLAALLFLNDGSHPFLAHGDLPSLLRREVATHVAGPGALRTGAQLISILQLIALRQLDAVLVHHFVADGAQTHLGLSERQATIWFVRELYQLYLTADADLTTCLPHWFLWCLRGALPSSVSSNTKWTLASENNKLATLVPAGPPPPNAQLETFLLQELCCLFAGSRLPLAEPGCVLDVIHLRAELPSQRQDSKDHARTPPAIFRMSQTARKVSGTFFSSSRAKEKYERTFLASTDLVEILLRISFGGLMDVMGKLPVPALETVYLKFSRTLLVSSDPAKDVFCLALQALSQLVVAFPSTRTRIDKLLGSRLFVTMMQGLCEAFQAAGLPPRLLQALISLSVNHCLRGEAFSRPILPFGQVSALEASRSSKEPSFGRLLRAWPMDVVQRPNDLNGQAEGFAPTVLLLIYEALSEVRVLSTVLSGEPSFGGAEAISWAELEPLCSALDFQVLRNTERDGEPLQVRPSRQSSRMNTFAEDQEEAVDSSSRSVPRRSSRRIVASTSVASLDTADAANRWDVESLGRSSAAYGDLVSRASMGSNQSVVAIMQALKSMPLEAVFQLPDCDDRLSGVGYPSSPPTPSLAQPTLTKENLVNRHHQELRRPFAAEDSRAAVEWDCDLLLVLSSQMVSIVPVIGVLHQFLLHRAGLAAWFEDAHEDAVSDFNSQRPRSRMEEQYFAVLRSHFRPFLSATRDLSQWDLPRWPTISFRDHDCMESLFALAVLFGEGPYAICRAAVNGVMQNTESLHALASSPSLLLVLHRVALSAPAALRTYLMGMLAHILSYSVDHVFLHYLLDHVQSETTQGSPPTIRLLDDALAFRRPRSFLKFPCRSLWQGKALTIIPSVRAKAFSLFLWLKLDWLDHGCTGSIASIKVGNLFVTLFARRVAVGDQTSAASAVSAFQLCIHYGSLAERPEQSTSHPQTRLLPTASLVSAAKDSAATSVLTDALCGRFFPDVVFDGHILDDDWKLLQLTLRGGKVGLSLNNVELPALRFTPNGYQRVDASEATASETRFVASLCALPEKPAIEVSFGGDHQLDALAGGLLASGLSKGDEVDGSQALVATSRLTIRTMGMRVSDVLLTDSASVATFPDQWVANGAAGGLCMVGTGYLFGQADITAYAQINGPLRPSQVFSCHQAFQEAASSRGSGRMHNVEPCLQQALLACEDVHVHVGQPLLDAMKRLGGVRVLLPLITSSTEQEFACGLLAFLLHSLELPSEYDAFRSEKLDAALVAACVTVPADVAAAMMAHLCSWSCDSKSPKTPAEKKLDGLAWAAEVVLLSPGNVVAATRYIKWIREQLVEGVGSEAALLRYVPLPVLLSMVTLWSFDDWAFDGESETPLPKGRDEKRRGWLEPATGLDSSRGGLDCAADACLLQAHAMRLLRALAGHSFASTAWKTPTGTHPVVSLLMAALFCSRKASTAVLMKQSDRRTDKENLRRSERLKARLRSAMVAVQLVRSGDCFTTTYWHTMACLQLLRLVVDTLLRDLSIVRAVGSAVLSQVVAELLASSVSEIRAQAVHLAMLSMASPDALIDQKRLADLEKQHFFELMAEQLTAPSEPFDDEVVEAVMRFLFWKIDFDRETKVASFPPAERFLRDVAGTGASVAVDIAVPPMLTSVFRLLHYCKSGDTMRALLLSLVDFRVGSKAFRQADSVTENNAEKVMARRDWVWDLADIVLTHTRRLSAPVGEDDAAGLHSVSESESVGAMSLGSSQRGVDYVSGADSDDSSSSASADERVFDLSPDTAASPSDHLGFRAEHIARLTEPVKTAFVFMVQTDLIKKPAATRHWPDIFRLALPEFSRLLEEFLTLVLREVETVEVVQQDGEEGLHYLANLGSLIEQVLEKAPVSLSFCVFAVRALQTLNYRCCQELRVRATRDVSLREARNALLVRVLEETAQDASMRAAAILELSSPLLSFIGQAEYKQFADAAVSALVFGLFLDVFDEMQNGVAGADADGPETAWEAQDDRAQGWIRAGVDCMTKLLELTQSIVALSTEAQRTFARIVENLPNDDEKLLSQFFFSGIRGGSNQTAAIESGRASARDQAMDAIDAADAGASSVSSGLWWLGGWGLSTSRAAPVPFSDGEERRLGEVTKGAGDSAGVDSREVKSSARSAQSITMWLCRNKR